MFWAPQGNRIADLLAVRAEMAARWLLADAEPAFEALTDARWLPDSP